MILSRLLAAACLLAAPAAAQEVSGSSPDPLAGRFVAIGGQLVSARPSCVQCHGLEGLGDTSGAFPRLAGLDGWTLYKALRDYAEGLRESAVMGPVASQLSDRQMQDVAAWYAGFQDLPYDHRPEVSMEERQHGGALVAVGAPERGIPACSSCHGASGVGGGVAFPRIAGQYAPYLRLQLEKWRAGLRDGDPMNVMERIARSMTPQDIRAVSLYLASVDPLAVAPPPSEPAPALEPATADPPYLSPPAETGAPR